MSQPPKIPFPNATSSFLQVANILYQAFDYRLPPRCFKHILRHAFPYPSSPEDVFYTAALLRLASRGRLPDELIKKILLHAEYDSLHFIDWDDRATCADIFHRGLSTYVETGPLVGLKAGRIRSMHLLMRGCVPFICRRPDGPPTSFYEVAKRKEAGGEVFRGPFWAGNHNNEEIDRLRRFSYEADGEDPGEEFGKWIAELGDGERVSIVGINKKEIIEFYIFGGSIAVEVEVWR